MHLDPCASCIAGSAQARGDQPDESIAISVAHHAHPAPARARGAQPDESIAISLPTLRASCPRAGACDTRRSIVNHFTAWSRAARRTRSLCTEPTRAETILPQESHSARRASPHHFVRDVRARPNDLAFSCERTNVNSDHKMMVGAFVCCNGVLDGCASTPLQGFAGYERLLG
jgi:hypothetical protein